MRAQFKEHRHAVTGQLPDRGAEQHGLPQVARPVTRVKRLALGRRPSTVE